MLKELTQEEMEKVNGGDEEIIVSYDAKYGRIITWYSSILGRNISIKCSTIIRETPSSTSSTTSTTTTSSVPAITVMSSPSSSSSSGPDYSNVSSPPYAV